MTANKRYEILNALPTYGPMYIPVTESGEPFYSEGFPVRFRKSDNTYWVANFQPGWTELKAIFELDNSSDIVVIAGGTCYLMNPDETNPLLVFGVAYESAFLTNDGRLILQGQTCLTIIEIDGTYWDTKRISWDGFKNLSLKNNIITGLAYYPMDNTDEWIEFSFNIDTKELTGGSYPKPI